MTDQQISPFTINEQALILDRYPVKQVNRSLQAWDATDEYLLNYCQALLTEPKRILIFNDSFGALACNLTDHQIFSVSDSYLAHQGCLHNLNENELPNEQVELLTSLDELPAQVDVILYRLPKSNALLSYQLSAIAQQYSGETGANITFIGGAKVKDIHTSTLKLFEKHLGSTTTSLAKKKSRLVFSTIEKSPTQLAEADNQWQLADTALTIHNHAGVFSRESLDIGARFFLDHLPKVKAGQQVIDLGCGNGVIGLSVLAKQSEAHVTFKDESYMAVASAEQNVKSNFAELATQESFSEQCQFSADDCLTEQDSHSADLILCNPPFHQQHATTDHIAWQMFNDAKRVLKKGGELRIIGNRQLGYHIKLQRVFGNCKTIASNKKFVVLASIKR